jgi:hypothetical protein
LHATKKELDDVKPIFVKEGRGKGKAKEDPDPARDALERKCVDDVAILRKF